MSKQVQISQKLFNELFEFFILEHDDETLREEIVKDIQEKFSAMYKRYLFTQAKVSDSPDERKKFMEEYLDVKCKNVTW